MTLYLEDATRSIKLSNWLRSLEFITNESSENEYINF